MQDRAPSLNGTLGNELQSRGLTIGHTRDKDRIRKIAISFPPSWATDIEKLKDCVFAENKERVVGVCGISGVLNILLIYVTEGYQNRGIGRTLLRKMMAIVKQEGYPFIILSVGWGEKDYNLPARKLFLEQGFQPVFNLGKQTVMILPIKKTTARLAFVGMRTSLSAVPKILLKKALEWIHGFVWT